MKKSIQTLTDTDAAKPTVALDQKENDKKINDVNPSALKHLFGKAHLKRLAESLSKFDTSFDQKSFISLASSLEALEMKARVWLIRDELKKRLPEDYLRALTILLQSAHQKKLNSFDHWPYTEFVQTYGLKHVEASLEALKDLTRFFTSEWAVRPFLRLHPAQTLAFLTRCAQDPNVHVRRWSSEGTRPRLPWGERLHNFILEPSLTLPILEKLKFDPELYVRKSVSNHLNDIAKDHPLKVIKILKQWKQASRVGTALHSRKVDWIISRSLRTLIKEGHPEALKLIGVSNKPQIKTSDFKMNKKNFKIGDKIEFEFDIQSLSRQPQKLAIDYIIHFVRANQKLSAKVFKLKTWTLSAKQFLKIKKAHSLKKITTRNYYPGHHALEIQINGKVIQRFDFKIV